MEERELGALAAQDTMAALGIPLSGTLVGFGRLMIAEHERRTSNALSAAESLTGLSREEIFDWVAATPDAVPLLIRVLNAAGNSGNDTTLRMLGQALGRVQRAPSQRPREELIVAAIEGLTDEHIQILAVLEPSADEEEEGPPPSTQTVVSRLTGRVATDIVPLGLMSMLPRGLFENPFGRYGGGEHWALSELGVAVRDAAIAANPRRVDGDE